MPKSEELHTTGHNEWERTLLASYARQPRILTFGNQSTGHRHGDIHLLLDRGVGAGLVPALRRA